MKPYKKGDQNIRLGRDIYLEDGLTIRVDGDTGALTIACQVCLGARQILKVIQAKAKQAKSKKVKAKTRGK